VIWTEEHVKKLFAINPSMVNGMIPYYEGLSTGECQKKWTGIKDFILPRKIAKDMNKCEENNGNEFSTALWHVVMPQLAKTNFIRPCGEFAIWRNMYRKASAKVEQEMKKEPQSVSNVMEILKNSIVKGVSQE